MVKRGISMSGYKGISMSGYKQGSKLGWSCGPSLPKLLSDHQIMLGGGPVVYKKTHHKRTLFKKKLIGTDFYAFMSFSCIARIVQML